MTPGRWITLLFGVPIALALIGWTAFSLVSDIGQASYPVSATIPLQNGHLVASTNGSDITLHQDQARSSTARLTGTVQYSLVRPKFTVVGTDVSLDCHIPTGNCGLNATLDVPADTPVDLVTGGGNVNASDLGGIVNFTTAGGDVTVNDLFSPHVRLETGGGNITLVFTKAPTSLDITSSGGDVNVVLPHGSTYRPLTVKTHGGDYTPSPTVPTSLASPHVITVDSGGGNVSITEAS